MTEQAKFLQTCAADEGSAKDEHRFLLIGIHTDFSVKSVDTLSPSDRGSGLKVIGALVRTRHSLSPFARLIHDLYTLSLGH